MKFLTVLFAFTSFAAFAAPQSASVAIALMERLNESDYGTRSVCLIGKNVVGMVPGSHWSIPSSVATGTLTDFPKSIVQLPSLQVPGPLKFTGNFKLLRDVNGVQYYSATGTVSGLSADICVYESKAVLE